MLDPAISFLEIYHKLIYEDIYKDLARRIYFSIAYNIKNLEMT